MSTKLLTAVLTICVAIALLFYLNRPEPSPGERLDEAMEEAGAALRDAGEAITDRVQDAQEDIKDDLQAAGTEFADMVATSAEKLSEEASSLLKAWQDTGIITEDGFNFDNAAKAVEESSLDATSKEKIISLLQEIRDAPETIEEKLRDIRAVLEGAG